VFAVLTEPNMLVFFRVTPPIVFHFLLERSIGEPGVVGPVGPYNSRILRCGAFVVRVLNLGPFGTAEKYINRVLFKPRVPAKPKLAVRFADRRAQRIEAILR